MGIYQNVGNSRLLGNITGSKVCPKCQEQTWYFKKTIQVPCDFRIWFIKVRIRFNIGFQYCPKCGFLRVELNKA